ncbi:Macrophage mannose receptor 1 [Folsomia candida]|uniref:Macrophage mannose receptor 1 n=1 Tax=Folsomia candida TaxID=158441 RepID=A0A226EQB3_FOLCA|nr:Macrophage mannose receptor 1 [Folsomia candida]
MVSLTLSVKTMNSMANEMVFCCTLFVILVSTVVSEDFSQDNDCRLQPISFGYYLGVSKTKYTKASKCCENKKMILASLKTLQEIEALRDALASESFWAEPIGPANGVYISSFGNVTSYQRFYPRKFGQSLKSRPTMNMTANKVCSIAYLASPHNISLLHAGVPCKNHFRFLCQQRNSLTKADDSSLLCPRVNYTELIEDTYLYANTQLEWRDARDCCEFKGGELFRTESVSDSEDVVQSLVDNAIMESKTNNSISFWTGGFKKLDKSHFTWSNSEHALLENITANAEFCIRGTIKDGNISVQDFPCETSLNSICRIKVPKKCPFVNMKELSLQNTYREYHYSDSYKLSWSEAMLCCREKGLELLSMISPQEGKALATYFQTSSLYEHRHQGFPYGIWTSGRQRKDKLFEFVAVKTKTKLEHTGQNHFIQSSSNGTCLQFVIDVRNSYFLNNVKCKSIRSFICEKPASVIYQHLEPIELREVGNKYLLAVRKQTWGKANGICLDHKMSLLNLNNFEEKKSLLPVLNLLSSSWLFFYGCALIKDESDHCTHATADGTLEKFWSSPLDPGLSMEFNPISYEGRKKENQKNFSPLHKQSQDRIQKKFRTLTIAKRPNVTGLSNCTSTAVTDGKIRVSTSGNCSDENRFICEMQDESYGICDTSSLVKSGQFLLSKDEATWEEAKTCCSLKGRNLISLTDVKNLRDIYAILKENGLTRPNIGIWTSGTNRITRERWTWTGSHEFVKSNIFYNDYTLFDELSVAEDDNQCLEAFANAGKVTLDHEDCDLAKPFMCDIKNVIALKSCENIRFEKLRRSQFYYALSKVSWIHAQDHVHEDPDFGVWIGLTSEISNHTTFKWTGSSKELSTDFTMWESPELHSPDPKASCVEGYMKNGLLVWKPMPCSKELRFICQEK